MIVTGTSHFVSCQAARRYYRQYGISVDEVNRKFKNGEISAGAPTIKPSERLRVNDEGRYEILTPEKVQP